MTAVEAFAPAKINLTLHVTGRRPDGYHLIDSLVAFADTGDRVMVTPAPAVSLEVAGPMAESVPEGPDNLVLRAAALIGVPAAIRLEKNLPVAAGIGGGSSDAAATLRALAEMSGRPMPGDLLALGADLPVCLLARAARMRGIGDDLSPMPAMPPVQAVLVNPGLPVSTAAVFRRLEKPDNPPMPDVLPGWDGAAHLIRWLSAQRNDLEAPALAEQPVIAQVIARLRKTPGCRVARMSGSGATCFGLFSEAEAARSAARILAADYPAWWVRAARLS